MTDTLLSPCHKFLNQNFNQTMKQTKSSSKTTKSAKTAKSNGQMRGKNTSKSNDTESGLRKLVEAQLKDIYWAEKALVKAIPKMIDNASAPELIDALDTHLKETEDQVERCEQVFEALGIKAQAKVCEAMKGLIEEAEEMMSEFEEGPTRDAAIICAAQKVEHYEIATYGTLASFLNILDETDASSIIESILEEEKNADETLTEVSMNTIAIDASEEG